MQVDLVGGYYDAGDNVKYGLPMAFTITTLAWGTLDYEKELKAAGEIQNAREAIRWGTDYFLKASATPNQLWVQVQSVSKMLSIQYDSQKLYELTRLMHKTGRRSRGRPSLLGASRRYGHSSNSLQD